MTKLSIPAPCAEKWQEMAPVSYDCRFCASCERQIVDFTLKTDTEILEHLRRNNNICGRFRNGQLDRNILSRPAARRSGLTAAAAGVAALLSAQQPAQEPPGPPVQTEINDLRINTGRPEGYNYLEEGDTTHMLSGKIVDAETGEGLIGATVLLAGTQTGTVTDADGFFSLKIPALNHDDKAIRLKISYTGYHSMDADVPDKIRKEDLSLLPLQMNFDPLVLNVTTGIVVVSKPSPVRRIRHFFHRLFH